jgi:hypothetical protein
MASSFEFSQGTLIIEVCPIKMLRVRQVRFA